MLGKKGLMQTGGKDAQGNPAPLYVTNLTDYQAEAQQEAEDKILIDISKSNNLYKDQILRDIMDQEAYGYPFNTTITAEELNKIAPTERMVTAQGESKQSFTLANIPIIGYLAKPISKLASLFGASPSWAAAPNQTSKQVASQEKWDIFLKLMEPRNNKYGSFIQAISQLEESKSIAEENAINTYIAGQGFLPIRECEEWAPKAGSGNDSGTGENQVCLKWKSQVPAIANKEGYNSALNARRDQYVADPKMGSTGPGNGPDVQENATGEPTPGGGGAPGPSKVESASDAPSVIQSTMSDSDVNIPDYQGDNGNGTTPGQPNTNPGDGDNGTTPGEDGGGADWTNFSSLLESIIGGQDSPSQSDLNFLDWLLNFLGGIYKNIKPLVTFKVKDLDNNQSLLYWASPNATDCKASNDWLSQTAIASTIAKKQGDSLGKKGELTITYPSIATTSESVIYRLDCQNTKGSRSGSVTIKKQ